MALYLALFRGINVSGKNIIKMESLRKQMDLAGYGNVQTYIQSGNVVFEAKETSKAKVSVAIESLIKKEYGHDITVFVLDMADMNKVAANNPYATRDELEEGSKKLYVTFLSEIPQKENIQKLYDAPIGDDSIEFNDDILYFKLATKASDSKLSNNLIESKLKLRATTRNWNTTIKLLTMLEKSEK